MNWGALFLSLKLAGLVCTICSCSGFPSPIGLPFPAGDGNSSSRRSSRCRWFCRLPCSASTCWWRPGSKVRSAGYIPRGPAPAALHLQGLALASVIYSLPFAVQPMVAAFSLVDPNLLNASAILGASRMRTFVRIVFPLSIRASSPAWY